MHYRISQATADTMTKLTELGYGITNFYGDGAVRMARKLDSGTVVSVFVRDDEITPPATIETQTEQARLACEGKLTIRFGPRKESLNEFLGIEHAKNRDRIESEGSWQ